MDAHVARFMEVLLPLDRDCAEVADASCWARGLGWGRGDGLGLQTTLP